MRAKTNMFAALYICFVDWLRCLTTATDLQVCIQSAVNWGS